ncbi:hypothetical protein KH5H1_71460 [Corallococcus caeni]|nr:hypothetical protein KH5H1_71460 [Corallococcus sp. KH5-1]
MRSIQEIGDDGGQDPGDQETGDFRGGRREQARKGTGREHGRGLAPSKGEIVPQT